MPRVKIIAKGFETYNGVLEGVQFENGLSTEIMSERAAERIGAFMRCVDADTEEDLGAGARLVRQRTQGQAPRPPLQRVERTPTGKEKKPIANRRVVSYDFTKADLEAVADKDGIQGLRKVAEQYDVRGRSIREIIDAMMALKANEDAKRAAETVKEAEARVTHQAEAVEPTGSDLDALTEE